MARGTPDNQGPVQAPAYLKGNQTGASDTRDMETERTTSMQMPPTGSVADMDRTDLADMQVVQDLDGKRQWLEDTEFDKQKLIIMVQDTTEAGAEAVVQVGVNGVNQFFPRGVEVECKRMFVEGLARAKPQRVATTKLTQASEADQFKVTRHAALAYPFSVIYDPAGRKGGDWLRKILAQG